jgi:glutathione peroxidase
MIRRTFLAAASALLASGATATGARESSRRAHEFSFTTIDGEAMPLAQFAGRPMLVVNTASRCGFTGQYDGLQAVWNRYRDRGLVVIGVPSDDFRQELDSNAAVKDFCEMNYGIDFPMTTITAVKGSRAHPFYAWAAEVMGIAPRWNFHKYLVDGEGRLVASFATPVDPLSRQITDAIEQSLDRKA